MSSIVRVCGEMEVPLNPSLLASAETLKNTTPSDAISPIQSREPRTLDAAEGLEDSEVMLDDFVITEASDKAEMVSLVGFDIIVSDEPVVKPEDGASSSEKDKYEADLGSSDVESGSVSRSLSLDDDLALHLNAHRTGRKWDRQEDIEVEHSEWRDQRQDYWQAVVANDDDDDDEGDWLEGSSIEEEAVSDWEDSPENHFRGTNTDAKRSRRAAQQPKKCPKCIRPHCKRAHTCGLSRNKGVKRNRSKIEDQDDMATDAPNIKKAVTETSEKWETEGMATVQQGTQLEELGTTEEEQSVALELEKTQTRAARSGKRSRTFGKRIHRPKAKSKASPEEAQIEQEGEAEENKHDPEEEDWDEASYSVPRDANGDIIMEEIDLRPFRNKANNTGYKVSLYLNH